MKSVKGNNIIKHSQKSIVELEKELLEAQLLAETYRKIIEVAEKELKINIVKSPIPSNSGVENPAKFLRV